MFSLQKTIRPNILAMRPYSSARSEFEGTEGIFLDANENPFGTYNRYPDPYQQKLKQQLAKLNSVAPENIFIGNGSDEILDLAFRIFCEPRTDKALTFSPTYGMYAVAANINDVCLLQVPLDEAFRINFDLLETAITEQQPKLLFVCSPNNPTGNILEDVEKILQRFEGIMLLDEAYIDFAGSASFIEKIDTYPNLIVAQTLSKAWGLAAARIGIAYASADLISFFNKVKPPYNVSRLNQEAALEALSDIAIFEKNKAVLLQQRAWLEQQLPGLGIVKKVYPSAANFLLVAVTDAVRVYQELVRHQVITRNRNNMVADCIRITVGNPEENRQLVKVLQQMTTPSTKKQPDEESTFY